MWQGTVGADVCVCVCVCVFGMGMARRKRTRVRWWVELESACVGRGSRGGRGTQVAEDKDASSITSRTQTSSCGRP